MNKYYCCYLINGRISRVISCPETDIDHQIEYGEFYLECGESVSDESSYVDTSATDASVSQKKPLGVSPIVIGFLASFGSLPNGSRVVVDNLEIEADGHPTEIEFDAPGTYEIRIYPPPQYRDEVLEVTVG